MTELVDDSYFDPDLSTDAVGDSRPHLRLVETAPETVTDDPLPTPVIDQNSLRNLDYWNGAAKLIREMEADQARYQRYLETRRLNQLEAERRRQRYLESNLSSFECFSLVMQLLLAHARYPDSDEHSD